MRHTILIVEDDLDASETLREFLEGEGYAVESARDGARALAVVERVDHLCLVLLDLHMPGMNGWDFLTAFRALPRFAESPVIVVTSTPERAPRGVAQVLPKPVALARVLAAAERLCPA